jgi:hypothetical protein
VVQGFEGRGSQHSQLQEMGISMAEMARRLGMGTSAIEFGNQEKELRRGSVSVKIVSNVPFHFTALTTLSRSAIHFTNG